MAHKNYIASKYTTNKTTSVNDILVEEEALQIVINGKPFTITMRTPGDDEPLVRGLLYCEDVYTDELISPPIVFEKQADKTIASVNIPEKQIQSGIENERSLISVSSCGICGKTQLDDLSGTLKAGANIALEQLNALFQKMEEKQDLFSKSGGSHAAAIFTQTGDLLSIKEDVGRHNAVDKSIGETLLNKQLQQAHCLTVSGRVSYEIVLKAFRAKIPILAAVSAPSSLAVDYARELGITLFAFCREGGATCYSFPLGNTDDTNVTD